MKKKNTTDPSKVFVIYGRNQKLNDALFDFLRALELRPLEWEELISLTGKSAPYVGDILEMGFNTAQCAIAFLTPDDEAQLREEYRGEHEKVWETTLTPQPRQNVLFEAGMAISKFPDRTIIVQIGEIRPASDVLGRHLIKMNNSPEMRHSLANRLKTAKCSVNQSGNAWLKAGDFSLDSLPDSTPDSLPDSTPDSLPDSPQDTLLQIPDAYKALSGEIKFLIENHFFDLPREAREVHNELEKHQRFHTIQDVHIGLRNAATKGKKPLKRLVGKPIKYVIRR